MTVAVRAIDKVAAGSSLALVAFLALAMRLAFPPMPDAQAADSPRVDDKVEQRIVLGDKQVALPEGAWRVAAVGTQETAAAGRGAFGAIRNVILFRQGGGHVTAAVEVNVNTVPVDNGWGAAPACEPAGQFLLVTRYQTEWDLSCMLVQATYTPAGGPGPQAWREALRRAAVAGLAVPDLWLTAAFRVSDRQDVLDVRYHFDPGLLIAALGAVPGTAADWAPPAVARSPERVAAVRLLASWAVGGDEWLERGMRNQLGDERLPMPRRAAFFSNTPQIDAKLAELERLFRAGALSTGEYLAQQRAALGEVPVLAADASPIERSFQKSLTLRVANSAVDYVLGFVVTVAAPVAGGWLAAPATLAYSALFILNDQLWEKHWAGKSPAETLPLVVFVHAGAPT
jgi:hypothetical protein